MSQHISPPAQGVPRRSILTARLARQFHTSPALAEVPREPLAAVSDQAVESGIADLFVGATLTPGDAAGILKCSVKTAHRIFKRMPGVVPTSKSSYLIPRSLFESWVRKRMTQVA